MKRFKLALAALALSLSACCSHEFNGVVQAKAGGAPISGARVSVYGGETIWSGGEPGSPPDFVLTTDAGGKFKGKLRCRAYNPYTVKVEAEGFAPGSDEFVTEASRGGTKRKYELAKAAKKD